MKLRLLGRKAVIVKGIEARVSSELRLGRRIQVIEVLPEDRYIRSALHIEVYAVPERVFPESLLYARIQYLENDTVVLELDLRLGRAYVHVHCTRLCLQIYEIGRAASFRDQLLVRPHNGLVEIRAPEISSVYEKELVGLRLGGRVRTGDIAVDLHHRSLRTYIGEILRHALAEHILYSEFQRLGGLQNIYFPVIVHKVEAHLITREGHMGEFRHDMLELHIVRLEELASGRHVVEKVPHREIRPPRSGRHGSGDMLRIRKDHFASHLILFPARTEGHLRHGGYGCKRLSPESECHDACQIFRRGYL